MAANGSLFTELQKRHVTRAAVAHIVIFWLLVQVADVVMPYLGVVENPVRWTIITGASLFPVTLLAAWFLEHPWHKFTGSRLAIDIVVIAVVAIAVASWAWRNLPQTIYTKTSLVVLPFKYANDDPLGRTLSRAIAYEVNSLLMHSETIDVTGFETAISQMIADLEPAAVASRLNVEHLFSGTIASSDIGFKLAATLFDSEGNELWRTTAEDEIDNLFAVQQALAMDLSSRIGGGTARTAVSRVIDERCEMPTDAGSLELYYEARTLFEVRGEDEIGNKNLVDSIAIFEQLIADRPEFAEAHSGLAWAYLVVPGNVPISDGEEWYDKAIAQAEIAFELCNTLGEAMVLLPNKYDHENTFINEQQNLSAAVRMQPEKTEMLSRYTRHLQNVGRVSEAIDLARSNYQRNPLSVRALVLLAGSLQYVEDFTESTVLYDEAIELGWTGPNFAEELEQLKDCRRSPDCMASMLPPPFQPMKEQFIELWTPPKDASEANAKIAIGTQLLEQSEYVNWFNMTACWFDHLTPLFYETWEFAERTGEYWYWPNVFHTSCGNVWTSDQFADFSRNVGLLEYWQQKGWPDMCAADGDSVVCRDSYATDDAGNNVN